MVEDDIVTERLYTIPLRDAKRLPRTKRAPSAVKFIRKFMARHMKVDPEKVLIDSDVNNLVWNKGREHIPSKVKVRAIKFSEEEIVEVTLPDTTISNTEQEEVEATPEEMDEDIEEEITSSVKEDIEKAEEA